ncbi:MAG: filamentous hemagglutinin N-terminal domain-containing protein, partial [Hyphomicrobiales bacterium]
MRSLSNPSRTREHQVRMLAGASVIVLMLASSGVAARSLGNSGGTPNAATAATSAATAASQQAATIAAQAQEALKRAAQSLRALQAIQGAAKAAAGTAATNGVTDGLSVGGLIVDPRAAGNSSLWQNINQPVQTTASGQTTVTLTQTSARAIATWQQFNVGRNTTVYFDQTGGNTSSGNSWIVLNRVDAFGVPSQILGQIKADGTVLVINPNGIIFGAGSQVNVGSLIATTHDIATSTNASVFTASNSNYVQTSVQSGGTTLSFYVPPNEDAANTYFLQNGLFNQQATNNSGNPSTNAGLSAILAVGNQTLGTPGGGSIVVQAGASISTNHTGSGAASDFVALIGPTVTNAGSITSNGQVILAASDAVVLRQPASAAVGVDLSMTVTAATGGNNIL